MPPKKLISKIKKAVAPKNTRQKHFDRLNDTKIYVNVKNEFMSKLPIQTQIGYIYKNQFGELIPIVSAFIQEHYISMSGLPGMMIKCGNRTYSNLYNTIEKIYIFKRDYEKISKLIEHNIKFGPTKQTNEELTARVKKLEDVLIGLTTKLTRSTSVQNIKPAEPKKRASSLTHDKKVPKKKAKPVVF